MNPLPSPALALALNLVPNPNPRRAFPSHLARLVCLWCGLWLLSGCQTAPPPPATGVPAPLERVPVGQMLVPTRRIAGGAWKAEAADWAGTPYRLGGLTHAGIDCSGLVFQLYRSVAGLTLPRTSAEQFLLGLPVSPNELQPGDLLFFRLAGPGIDHVGVAVGGRQFAHATVHKGVMVSSLGDRYYASRLYAVKRLVP